MLAAGFSKILSMGAAALALGAMAVPIAQASQPSKPVFSAKLHQDIELLAGYVWQLTDAYDASGAQQKQWHVSGWPPIPVYFTADGWVGTSVCNSMSWRYKPTENNAIKIIGHGATTTAGCGDPLGSLQQPAAKLFSAGFHYQLHSLAGQPPSLALTFGDGSRWELRGEPTPRTKYGSDGTPALLEVDGPHVPCEQGAKGQECLRVRLVEWGVRDGKGYFFNQRAWQKFPLDAIDKWTHKPGWHGVLNVQQFPLKAAQRGSAPYAYLFHAEYTTFSPP